jgi:hypothetical protein
MKTTRRFFDEDDSEVSKDSPDVERMIVQISNDKGELVEEEWYYRD